jgi:hypothetical protein
MLHACLSSPLSHRCGPWDEGGHCQPCSSRVWQALGSSSTDVVHTRATIAAAAGSSAAVQKPVYISAAMMLTGARQAADALLPLHCPLSGGQPLRGGPVSRGGALLQCGAAHSGEWHGTSAALRPALVWLQAARLQSHSSHPDTPTGALACVLATDAACVLAAAPSSGNMLDSAPTHMCCCLR